MEFPGACLHLRRWPTVPYRIDGASGCDVHHIRAVEIFFVPAVGRGS